MKFNIKNSTFQVALYVLFLFALLIVVLLYACVNRNLSVKDNVVYKITLLNPNNEPVCVIYANKEDITASFYSSIGIWVRQNDCKNSVVWHGSYKKELETQAEE
jgi:hypothetical protein